MFDFLGVFHLHIFEPFIIIRTSPVNKIRFGMLIKHRASKQFSTKVSQPPPQGSFFLIPWSYLCDDFGHSNFDDLCVFIEEVTTMCPGLNGSALIKDVRMYQKVLKTLFSKLIQKHSPYLELYMSYAFDSCAEEHKARCSDVLKNLHSAQHSIGED